MPTTCISIALQEASHGEIFHGKYMEKMRESGKWWENDETFSYFQNFTYMFFPYLLDGTKPKPSLSYGKTMESSIWKNIEHAEKSPDGWVYVMETYGHTPHL